MTRHSIFRTIAFGCMLLAFGKLAGAGDLAPFTSGAGAAPSSMVARPSTAMPGIAPPAQRLTSEGPIRETAWAKRRPAMHRPAPDTMTVKAARSSLQLMDQGSNYSRQQRFAALDLRGEHWFDFR